VVCIIAFCTITGCISSAIQRRRQQASRGFGGVAGTYGSYGGYGGAGAMKGIAMRNMSTDGRSSTWQGYGEPLSMQNNPMASQQQAASTPAAARTQYNPLASGSGAATPASARLPPGRVQPLSYSQMRPTSRDTDAELNVFLQVR